MVHYFITGHTGFKGSWLIHLLRSKGHTVSGYSDQALPNSLFVRAESKDCLELDYRGDIRNLEDLTAALKESKPDVLIHLAAQSLVTKSYLDPLETFSTNVDGTRNVLLAARQIKSLVATLIVTTDKVYRDSKISDGYIESDPLGGHDPYSSSKAMADLMTQSFIHLNPQSPIGIARAGNVIGGGDIGEQRLIPDIIRAIEDKTALELRYPKAVRPWQHVLDCLNGYLEMISTLIASGKSSVWNVGPDARDFNTVEAVVRLFLEKINVTIDVRSVEAQFVETSVLKLNSDKLRMESDWKNKLTFEDSVEWTAAWHSLIKHKKLSPAQVLNKQITDFIAL
jgi:CDP-glucose 4,6-dehydratase